MMLLGHTFQITVATLLLATNVRSFRPNCQYVGKHQTPRKLLVTRTRLHPRPLADQRDATLSVMHPRSSSERQRKALFLSDSENTSPLQESSNLPFPSRRSFYLDSHRAWFATCRRRIMSLVFAFLVVFSCFTQTTWAVTGGRMGGSFGSSGRSSSSPSSSAPSRAMPRARSYGYDSSPRIHVHVGPRTRLFGSYGTFGAYDTFPGNTGISTTRLSPSEIALLTGTVGLLAYGFMNTSRKDGETSPLGPGATAVSLTVSLQVPDRDDPGSILNKLRRISESVNTSSRKGVQDLVTEGT